jgi:hypothetical protein
VSRPLLDQRSGPLGHGRSAKVACPERRGTTNVTADTHLDCGPMTMYRGRGLPQRP